MDILKSEILPSEYEVTDNSGDYEQQEIKNMNDKLSGYLAVLKSPDLDNTKLCEILSTLSACAWNIQKKDYISQITRTCFTALLERKDISDLILKNLTENSAVSLFSTPTITQLYIFDCIDILDMLVDALYSGVVKSEIKLDDMTKLSFYSLSLTLIDLFNGSESKDLKDILLKYRDVLLIGPDLKGPQYATDRDKIDKFYSTYAQSYRPVWAFQR